MFRWQYYATFNVQNNNKNKQRNANSFVTELKDNHAKVEDSA